MAEIDLSAEEEALRAECIGLAKRLHPNAVVEVETCLIAATYGTKECVCARAFVPKYRGVPLATESEMGAATEQTAADALAKLKAKLGALV